MNRIVVEGFATPADAAVAAERAQSQIGRLRMQAPRDLAVEVDGTRLIFTGFDTFDRAVAYAERVGAGAPATITVEVEEVKLVSFRHR